MRTTGTTLGQRFGGFVVSHLVLSIPAFLIFVGIYPLLETGLGSALWGEVLGFAVAGLLAIGGYFFAGRFVARRANWSVPTRREKVWAVVQPCFLLAVWALLAVGSICYRGDAHARTTMLTLSGFLGMPSTCCFVFAHNILRALDVIGHNDRSIVITSVIALLSAVLPPLLFALGSWRTKGQKTDAK